MHHETPPLAPPRPDAAQPHAGLVRASAAIAATTVTFALFSSLLVTFDSASPRYWLAPTQEVLELFEVCDSLVDQAQRDHCKRRFVAAGLSNETPPVQMSRR